MIKEFVAAWDARKAHLEAYLRTHQQEEYDEYRKLVRLLIVEVLNPYLYDEENYELDGDQLHEIDDGYFQGDKLFFVHKAGSDSPDDYVWLWQGYGSCTACDTLLFISEMNEGLPTDKQVKEYMTLMLHMVQRFRWLISTDEYYKEG